MGSRNERYLGHRHVGVRFVEVEGLGVGGGSGSGRGGVAAGAFRGARGGPDGGGAAGLWLIAVRELVCGVTLGPLGKILAASALEIGLGRRPGASSGHCGKSGMSTAMNGFVIVTNEIMLQEKKQKYAEKNTPNGKQSVVGQGCAGSSELNGRRFRYVMSSAARLRYSISIARGSFVVRIRAPDDPSHKVSPGYRAVLVLLETHIKSSTLSLVRAFYVF